MRSVTDCGAPLVKVIVKSPVNQLGRGVSPRADLDAGLERVRAGHVGGREAGRLAWSPMNGAVAGDRRAEALAVGLVGDRVDLAWPGSSRGRTRS